MRTWITVVWLMLVSACTTGRARKAVPDIPYSVQGVHPHDTTAYTEGLLVHDGALYESTGSPKNRKQARSLFGVVNTVTGRIDVKAELDREKYFGEGIAFLDGKVYQLTYKSREVLVYDARTFVLLQEVKNPSPEGWGMTTDGTFLIMSNGTSKILFIDPVTFKTVKTLKITGPRGRVRNLNELELIQGALYANVWRTDRIVKIDTSTGAITGEVHLSALVKEAKRKYPGAKELNGIAYDSASRNVYLSGKMWPYVYELSFSY